MALGNLDLSTPVALDSHNHDTAYASLTHSHAAPAHTHAEYAPVVHTHAGVLPVYAVLPDGSTVLNFATNTTVKLTPTANATLTTPVPPAGSVRHLIILTSGTVSRTLTFGAGFKATGTLATGTVAARVFVLSWISDGASLYEVSRTAAMVA